MSAVIGYQAADCCSCMLISSNKAITLVSEGTSADGCRCLHAVNVADNLPIVSQPFYHVLPDENDCVRLFNAVRISKYVAQENVELLPQPRRCTHRVLPNYFVGFDPVTGRFVYSHSEASQCSNLFSPHKT